MPLYQSPSSSSPVSSLGSAAAAMCRPLAPGAVQPPPPAYRAPKPGTVAPEPMTSKLNCLSGQPDARRLASFSRLPYPFPRCSPLVVLSATAAVAAPPETKTNSMTTTSWQARERTANRKLLHAADKLCLAAPAKVCCVRQEFAIVVSPITTDCLSYSSSMLVEVCLPSLG